MGKLSAWISIIAIIAFITSVFLWIYDAEGKKFSEKVLFPAIGITAFLMVISLLLIAPPSIFTYSEAQILIVLIFAVIFGFLTLAEEDKLRVILFGAAIAFSVLIIFLPNLLPLDYLRGLSENALENLTADELEQAIGRKSPFGTVTGVIGVQVLSQEGHPVTFMEFVKKMGPLSAILLGLGFLYLIALQFLGILPALLPG